MGRRDDCELLAVAFGMYLVYLGVTNGRTAVVVQLDTRLPVLPVETTAFQNACSALANETDSATLSTGTQLYGSPAYDALSKLAARAHDDGLRIGVMGASSSQNDWDGDTNYLRVYQRWARVAFRQRAGVRIYNAAQGGTMTPAGVLAMPALLPRHLDLDMLLWEYAQNDCILDNAAFARGLEAFIHMASRLHPRAILGFVFVWDSPQCYNGTKGITWPPISTRDVLAFQTLSHYGAHLPIFGVSLAVAIRTWLSPPDYPLGQRNFIDRDNSTAEDHNHPNANTYELLGTLLAYATCASTRDPPQLTPPAGPLLPVDEIPLLNGPFDANVATVLKDPEAERRIPFSLPHFGRWHGETFACLRTRVPWDPPEVIEEPLTPERITSVQCDNFDVKAVGVARNSRSDRKYALHLPHCMRGNFSVSLPYASKSIELFEFSSYTLVTRNSLTYPLVRGRVLPLAPDVTRHRITYCRSGNLDLRGPAATAPWINIVLR